MDPNALREAAIEATARALYDRNGVSASEDSEEWEEEYRRQFALLKRQGGVAPAAPPAAETLSAAAAAIAERQWPALSGTPEQKRWAATIRAERFVEIPSEPVRGFLAQAWTRSKVWIDTRDVPTAVLLQRLRPQYEEYRKKLAEAAKARAAAAQHKAAAIAAHQQKLQAAGITPEGLVELVDASERFDLAPLAEKLAEIDVEGRNLRIFATSDPNLLLVKEKKGPLHEDYAIERDEGLVADLRLFAQAD